MIDYCPHFNGTMACDPCIDRQLAAHAPEETETMGETGFDRIKRLDRERARHAALYYQLKEAGKSAEAAPHGERARSLVKEISALRKTLTARSPGGYLFKAAK